MKYSVIDEEQLLQVMEDAQDHFRDEIEEDERQFGADKLPEHQKKFDIFLQEEKDASKNRYIITAPPKIKENRIFEDLISPNEDQRKRVMHNFKSIKTEKGPLHIFLSGSVGFGKTEVINRLYQLVTKNFDQNPGSGFHSLKTILCAASGKASFLVKGVTLHTAFALPVNQHSGQIPEH